MSRSTLGYSARFRLARQSNTLHRSIDMGYPTDSAKWPTTVPSTVVQLYDLFFSLVDTRSETSGSRLAEEIFTQDGIFIATSGSFEGREGILYTGLYVFIGMTLIRDLAIRTCRKGVWNTVISRHHEVRKVFACDTDGEILDLILAGAVEVENSDQHKHTHEFIVRSVVVRPKSSYPRVKHYQVFIPAPKTPQPLLT